VEAEPLQVPPVVAVVVVHDPGTWFDETLDSLAGQDYPGLRFLFLLASDGIAHADEGADGPDSVESRIVRRIPDAFVRSLGANPGFGPAANEVLRFVEGDNGFFLICHDDIAPEPDALRIMVEEIYRSNAGAVGPKLVEWDDPSVLQAVGLEMDRFGEIDPVIEPGEVDQEQHDGVRDVFALPSAFFLIRADLFRELGGFDPAIDFHGDDVELCWRLHHSGARVMVAPSARVRHRAALAARRPDLHHGLLRARHRMRAVATMTGASRLPGRSLEMVVLTFVELVVGLFTARFGQAWASTRALWGLLPRTPAILARRRAVKEFRRVPEREVHSLQERGSARLNSYLRSRDTEVYAGADVQVRRWRQSATAPVIAWIVVIAGLIVGSRSFFDDGIPAVGEFLRFPDSPRLLLDSYVSGWNATGAGATSANPTGWATLWGLSVLTLFRMGLLHTVFILGLILVGIAGTWKLATVFPSTRARVAALLVYAASPLVSGAMAGGRLTVLVAYASTPWIIHLLRRAAGVETADPTSAELDLPDGVFELSIEDQVRRTLAVAIVIALATAFAPIMLPMAVLLSILLAVGSLLALAPWRTAIRFAVAGAAASAVAALLNLPWILTWTWEGLVGPPPIGSAGLGLFRLAAFEIGPTEFAALALALYLPVIAAVALARAWRLTWAVRSGVIVLAFGGIAVLADRGSLPIHGPQAGVLLVPVAVGLAVSAAAALAAFDLDVRGGTFGWRQPLGLLASVAVVVGIVPGVAALADGAWRTPTTPLSRLIEASLPDETAGGDYHVLLVGDPRILPVPSTEYRDGMAWAVIDDADLDIRDRWMPPANDAADLVNTALDQIASSSTLRGGRLLAPLGIRYIVVPQFDGVVSTTAEPLPLPRGLVTSLEDQLDLVTTRGLPTIDVFENRAWLPSFSVLDGPAAEASRAAGADVLVRTDLSQATPAFVGADQFATSTDDVPPGVVHLAVPFDDRWRLEVEGETATPRRAFGVTTAFDTQVGGRADLWYDTAASRSFLIALQFVLWMAVIIGAFRVSVPMARRARPVVADETLIDLTQEPLDHIGPIAARSVADPGLDITGQLARPAELSDVDTDDDANVGTGVGADGDNPTGADPESGAGSGVRP
jgi:GT2 family glycosyltransferase